jgi:hypothetical protein
MRFKLTAPHAQRSDSFFPLRGLTASMSLQDGQLKTSVSSLTMATFREITRPGLVVRLAPRRCWNLHFHLAELLARNKVNDIRER